MGLLFVDVFCSINWVLSVSGQHMTRLNVRISCFKIIDSAHDKTYYKMCNQWRLISLRICAVWSVFSDRMCLLQPPGYSKRDEWEPLLYWVDVHADLSLCWSHKSDCRVFLVLAHILLPTYCLFVLRFYGPVNPMGPCRARSVYLTTRLLDRLSPLSG